MRELVEFLARALVEDPDSVQVEELEENGDLVLEITVGGDDLGRVIGKGGRVANAIRTVAKAASTRGERRVLGALVLGCRLFPLPPPVCVGLPAAPPAHSRSG